MAVGVMVNERIEKIYFYGFPVHPDTKQICFIGPVAGRDAFQIVPICFFKYRRFMHGYTHLTLPPE